MLKESNKYIAAGARVKVAGSMEVPAKSIWEDDKQRTSTSVKRRLQQLFFRGDRRISAQVVFIGNLDERTKLRNNGWTKIEIRDAAGCMIVITAPLDGLKKAS